MCTEMSGLIELRRRTAAGVVAIPYRGRRRRKPIRLPDGAIVEVPARGQRREAPECLEAVIGLAGDGTLATIHHANLGLVTTYVGLEGVYLLPSGEIAAVYGAQASPIG